MQRVELQDGEVIFEVGSSREEGSTGYLAKFARVISVDIDPNATARVRDIPNVSAINDLAENVIARWTGTPIRFAWLDGHDWPYSHHPDSDWEGQRRDYTARGQAYSQQASQMSHLEITMHLAGYVPKGGIIAYDDTWHGITAIEEPRDEEWSGKGGTAVPWLIKQDGWILEQAGDIYDGLVIMRKVSE